MKLIPVILLTLAACAPITAPADPSPDLAEVPAPVLPPAEVIPDFPFAFSYEYEIGTVKPGWTIVVNQTNTCFVGTNREYEMTVTALTNAQGQAWAIWTNQETGRWGAAFYLDGGAGSQEPTWLVKGGTNPDGTLLQISKERYNPQMSGGPCEDLQGTPS